MNKLKTIQPFFSKVGFQLKKHSPEILLVTGVIGVVGAAVMACRATLKARDILEDSKDTLEALKKYKSDNDGALDEDGNEVISEDEYKKAVVVTHIRAGLQFAKLYGPSIAIGVLAIGSIFASNDILRKRNVALGAAFATVTNGFKEYRSRVIQRFGEEVDKELKYNISKKQVERTITDENGKEKKVKETISVVDINDYSGYARYFDDSCPDWERDNSDYNLMFLKGRQQMANDQLIANGYLFLNDVYKSLGIPTTKTGHTVGWLYKPEGNPNGDNFVSFGIFETHKERTRDFVNGYESAILLDFNVDGDILNDVKWEGRY